MKSSTNLPTSHMICYIPPLPPPPLSPPFFFYHNSLCLFLYFITTHFQHCAEVFGRIIIRYVNLFTLALRIYQTPSPHKLTSISQVNDISLFAKRQSNQRLTWVSCNISLGKPYCNLGKEHVSHMSILHSLLLNYM